MTKTYPYPVNIERLQKLMHKNHLTTSTLSRIISPSGADNLVHNWISRQNSRPRRTTVEMCCKALNTTPDYLFPAPEEASAEQPAGKPAPELTLFDEKNDDVLFEVREIKRLLQELISLWR